MLAAADLPWQELHANLRAFIGRRVRNPADVEDLVQRVLLQILGGVGGLRDADRLHAWVYRTARNVIADHYRSPRARREVASGDAESLAEAQASPSPADDDEDEGAALRELADCLAPMLRQLAPAYREAVILADLEGVSQADAARRAGLSVSGMKSRVQRGRRELKAVLEACCRIDLDSRRAIIGYEPRTPAQDPCARCDSCGE
jgi:RNA polymerase sigma-70 factor (ECF subfamily)